MKTAAGLREQLPANLPSKLARLIVRAWDMNPEVRPVGFRVVSQSMFRMCLGCPCSELHVATLVSTWLTPSFQEVDELADGLRECQRDFAAHPEQEWEQCQPPEPSASHTDKHRDTAQLLSSGLHDSSMSMARTPSASSGMLLTSVLGSISEGGGAQGGSGTQGGGVGGELSAHVAASITAAIAQSGPSSPS